MFKNQYTLHVLTSNRTAGLKDTINITKHVSVADSNLWKKPMCSWSAYEIFLMLYCLQQLWFGPSAHVRTCALIGGRYNRNLKLSSILIILAVGNWVECPVFWSPNKVHFGIWAKRLFCYKLVLLLDKQEIMMC